MTATTLHSTRRTGALEEFRLDRAELALLDELVGELSGQVGEARDGRTIEFARAVARGLPPRLLETLDHMRLWEQPAGLVVTGYRLDDSAIGPTPPGWRAVNRRVPDELLLLLLTAPLGEPYAWSTQQEGRLVHDILPAPGDEHVQLGSSSATELLWHTEDAFHELRCDYLALQCLRNDDAVGTTLAIPDVARLSDTARAVLSEPRFHVLPDDSHLSARNPGRQGTPGLARLFDDVEKRLNAPVPVPVLFGPADRPYLRIDPAYMAPVPGDDGAAAALAEAYSLVEASMRDVALAPGDMLILDNYRGVHGRRPFQARYDGRDRWLKRVSVTRDLRRQRASAVTTDASHSWVV